MNPKVDMIIDLQYGSTGKGLIAGYLGVEGDYDVVVNANMPNAGHTYIDNNGNKMVHKVLPSAVCGKMLSCILLGAGSIFDLAQLNTEIVYLKHLGYLKDVPIYIHPNAIVLQPHHRRAEEGMDSIGSTKQGAGAAMIEKITRNPEVSSLLLARANKGRISDVTEGAAQVISHLQYNNVLDNARSILAEGAQGFSLGLNSKFWPFCTSRECTPARFLSDMNIPIPMLNHVIGVARVHPIRVGGESGPIYLDQTELTWADIGQPEELTTVTKRVRRVFTWSETQMRDAMFECQPDHIFLNFCNYDDKEATRIQRKYADHIRWLGYGPAHKDILRLL